MSLESDFPKEWIEEFFGPEQVEEESSECSCIVPILGKDDSCLRCQPKTEKKQYTFDCYCEVAEVVIGSDFCINCGGDLDEKMSFRVV